MEKKLILNKSQIELLDIIQSFRYIPLKVLVEVTKSRSLYSYKQTLNRVLLKLERVGYLRSFLYGNNWKVVYITKAGAKRLAFELSAPIAEIAIPNQGQRVQYATLEHTVQIARLYKKVSEVIANSPAFSINKWIGDQHIICQYKFRSARSGRTIRRNLLPDSYFEVSSNENTFRYFLEYDTGTMDKAQLVPKFMRYFEYFIYGDWEKRFESFPEIVFLTDRSKEALDNLFPQSEIAIEAALDQRNKFSQSENVIWKGIGTAENLRSINSTHIRGFLSKKIFVDFTDSKWVEKLLKI